MRPVTKYLAYVRIEASMNQSGSSRPWISRLLSLAMAFALCFTLATSVLHAQQNCVFADVNGDGVVDDSDLLQVLFCFGTQTQSSIPIMTEMVALHLQSAFPSTFPGAPEVPFDPGKALFARVRQPNMVLYTSWNIRIDLAQFTLGQIAQGLIVGAVYLPPGGVAPDETPLREGFYLVRMHSTDMASWRADLLDAHTGRVVVANLPATVTPVSMNIPGTFLDFCLELEYRLVPRPGIRLVLKVSWDIPIIGKGEKTIWKSRWFP